MPTLTTNFSLNKPVVNSATDEDIWGGYLNDNFDTIDTQLKVCRDSIKRNISASDSLVAGDRRKTLLVDATSGAVTLTLLAAATAADGFEFCVKKTDSSANAVTLDGNASETIDGATTYALSGQNASAIIMCDGSNWHVKAYKTTASAVSSASTTAEGIIEIATSAEVQAGSSTSLAVTPGDMKTALGYSNYYESSEQTVSFGSAITLTHSLGAIPKYMIAELVCKTTNLGYAVGDRVVLADKHGDSSGNMGVAIGYNTTQLFCVLGSSTIQLLNKSTGVGASITAASWRVVLRAWE